MLQHLADGLVIGAVIGLGAVGVSLTYAILRFANFAHGEFISWGAYLALGGLDALTTAFPPLGRPLGPFSFGPALPLALVMAVLLVAALALLLDRLLFAPLGRHGQAITLVIASFGAALALRNLLFFSFGGAPRYFTREIQIGLPLLPRELLGGVRVTPDQLCVLALALLALLALHLYLERTTTGRAMRAVAENPSLAALFGIDVRRIRAAVWAIGAGLATLSGAAAGLLYQLRPTMGFDLLLPLFAAAILGGIGSMPGAVLGGLVIGLAESLAVPLIGAEYRAAVAFIVLILLLMLRPTGLFGQQA